MVSIKTKLSKENIKVEMLDIYFSSKQRLANSSVIEGAKNLGGMFTAATSAIKSGGTSAALQTASALSRRLSVAVPQSRIVGHSLVIGGTSTAIKSTTDQNQIGQIDPTILVMSFSVGMAIYAIVSWYQKRGSKVIKE